MVEQAGHLPDIPTPSIIVDPENSNHVYVGTDLGVFVSTTGGGNWQDFNDGLPNSVQAMDLNICLANNVLRVMTHGNGAFERKLLSTSVTNVDEKHSTIDNFKLEQNYPNPFNPTTVINYRLTESGFVTLKVYDILGNEVETLVNNVISAGEHKVDFIAGNLPSGTYIYKLEFNGHIQTKKMILLK